MFTNIERIGFVAIAIVTAAASAVLASAAVPAGKARSAMQIKPGLWEFSDTAKVLGDTVFADALTARVPAGQRAEHLAELRRMISQPSRERECVNQAAFEKRLFTVGSGCRQTVLSNTASRIEIVTECQTQSGGFTQRTTSMITSSPTAVITSIHAVSTQAGKTMVVDSVQRGHWVSSSCGNVHGIEQMR